MTTDFTRPWLRGKKLVPRRGDEPPRLVDKIKIVPIKDEEGNIIKPKVIHGVPARVNPWVKPE